MFLSAGFSVGRLSPWETQASLLYSFCLTVIYGLTMYFRRQMASTVKRLSACILLDLAHVLLVSPCTNGVGAPRQQCRHLDGRAQLIVRRRC